MAYSVETYSIPRDSLEDWYGKESLLRQRGYVSVQYPIRQLDLRQTGRVITTPKGGQWEIYEYKNLAVPNFPEGETSINLMLGYYQRMTERKKGVDYKSQAILRLSPEPIDTEEFRGDLEKFTKYYVERPGFLGFPSRLLSSGWAINAAITSGAILAFLYGFNSNLNIWGSESRLVEAVTSAEAGAILGGGSTFILNRLSERYAKSQISSFSEYHAGSEAEQVLGEIHDHSMYVSIQNELYSVLKEKGADMQPRSFLWELYSRLPDELVDKRKQELERELYPDIYHGTQNQTAKALMLEYAQLLLDVKVLEKQKRQLKQRINEA